MVRERVREGEGREMLHYHLYHIYFNSDIPPEKIKSLKLAASEEGRASNGEGQMHVSNVSTLTCTIENVLAHKKMCLISSFIKICHPEIGVEV
jgi:hypothetical protein